jgi:hypothetical protein
VKRILLVLSLFFVWATVSADEIKKPEKPYSVSIGPYAERFSSSPSNGDIDLSGYSLALGQVFLDNFGARITFYSLDRDDLSSWEGDGWDVAMHWGTGLASQGFKAYIGGGFFKDNLDISGTGSFSFDGLQINGGIGYNWNHIALDFILSVRDPDDYEKFAREELLNDVSIDAYSGSLLLSYRF